MNVPGQSAALYQLGMYNCALCFHESRQVSSELALRETLADARNILGCHRAPSPSLLVKRALLAYCAPAVKKLA